MWLKVISVLSLGAVASPALADDYIGFRSPSGNIQCGIYSFDGVEEARCDLMQLTPSYTTAPAGCDLDWGQAFVVGASGKGILGCVGDSMNDPSNVVLDYGQAVSLGAIRCVSSKAGMTCTNTAGHGFRVAKGGQELF